MFEGNKNIVEEVLSGEHVGEESLEAILPWSPTPKTPQQAQPSMMLAKRLLEL